MTANCDERGLSDSVQHSLVFPVLMLATLGVIQAGIWIHGHSVAARAAAAGVDIARGSHGEAIAAQAESRKLADAGGLHDITIHVRRDATSAEVVVSGRAPLMLDLGLAQITERASAPLERVTQP
jgi:TadE-like protein